MQVDPGARGRRGLGVPVQMLRDLVRVFAFDVVRAMAVLLILGFPLHCSSVFGLMGCKSRAERHY